jgi:phage tail P2-like protein
MKTIYEENLKKLAPKIIKDDVILEVIQVIIDKHINQNIKFLVFLDRIDEMNEKELDLIANELHVDFFDYTMTIEEKRKSCKKSFEIHAIKGTVGAVKEVLDLFFPTAEVKQFYEYDGIPGRFKINITGTVPANVNKIVERIEDSKKKSQHLEGLSFYSNHIQLYYDGAFLVQGVKQDIKQELMNFYFPVSNVEMKSNMKIFEKTVQKQN